MRTVGTKLTAEVAPYISGMKAAGEATDELADKIGDTRDESVSATVAADGLGRAVDHLGDNMTEADRAAGRLDKNVSQTAHDMVRLDAAIAASTAELKLLARALIDTDDAAQRLDIKKAMSRVQSDLNASTKAKKILVDVEPQVERSKLKGLTDDLVYTAKTAAAQWKPILGAGIVAASPLIGSALAGAIIGGAGVGGVIGGIMLVKDDPRVEGAAKGLASRVGDRLKNAAQPFVDTTVQGLATVETSLDKIDFEGIFKKASTFVQPLSTAVGHVAEDLGAGFGSLVQVADPVIKSISHGLEGIGQAAEDGMKSLTDNADTAAASLGTLLDTVKTTTTVTFGLVNGLAELKAKLDSSAGGIFALDAGLQIINAIFNKGGNGTKWVDPVTAFDNAVANGIGTVDSYGQAITTAGQSLGDFAAQEIAAGSASHTLFDTASTVGEAFDNLTESIKKNGKSLDSSTEKGRANRTALSRLAGALNDNYAAYVAVNGAGQKADGIATMNYSSFIKAARGLGISEKAARNYAAQLGLIPPKKDTKATANTKDAAAKIRALQAQINALRGKTITIKTVITGGSLAGGIHVSGPGGSGTLTKADGGPITGPGPKGRDSVLAMVAPGEHVWTAREVDAAGGHGAMMQMRSAALAGPQHYAAGGPSPRQNTRVMPAPTSTMTVVVHEHRISFAEAGGELGRLVTKAMRTSPGLTAEMKNRLGLSTAAA